MEKFNVFITRRITQTAIDQISELCKVDLWEGDLPPGRDEMLKHAVGMDGILCLLTDKIDDQLLEAAGAQLKVVSNMAVGFDNVDVTAATRHGIPVGNTPGILTDATADFAFTLLMASGRRVCQAAQYLRDGKWQTWGPSTLLGADFKGATLGLVGFGRIGQAVAKRAAGFEMRVLFYDPSAQPVPGLNAQPVQDLDELLANSDFVSLHVPLTEKTRHMVDAAFLSKMKPNATLVNTSRGAVVDQTALYKALRQEQIRAAALDVTDPEPLPLDDPLLTLDNCLITPHIASASHHTRTLMAEVAAQNLLLGLQGKPLLHSVNPQVYEEKP